MAALPAGLDSDIVACHCGHLPDEHGHGFFAACEFCDDCDDYASDPNDVHAQLLRLLEDVTSARLPIDLATTLVGLDPQAWKGNCFAIATKLHAGAQAAGTPLGGRVVYGHYRGYIAPGSFFSARARNSEWVQHGWIDLGDGTVVDPTRWVFENVAPYIYEGPDDEYDEGGNILRSQTARPCPPRQADKPTKAVNLSPDAAQWLSAMSDGLAEPAAMDGPQRFWLANLALPALGQHAAEVYAALTELGESGLVPIDNRKKICG